MGRPLTLSVLNHLVNKGGMGKEFGGLMEEAPHGLYVVERHQLTEKA